MKVAAVQTRPVFGEKSSNIDRALNMMEKEQADLFVLPELFATGYLFKSREELESLAEPAGGQTFLRLAEFSVKSNCTVCAGFAETTGDKIFNSCMLINNGEPAGIYRKLHLFKNEKAIFDKARNPPSVFDLNSAKVGLMVCFDWVFPEMARTLALKGAQILCHPSNLVLPFCQQAMVTRSIENGVFTLLSNRIGKDERNGESLLFTGKSEIIDPKGSILAQASADKEEIISADIIPSKADDKMITPSNHLFYDRRTDFYG